MGQMGFVACFARVDAVDLDYYAPSDLALKITSSADYVADVGMNNAVD